jgi:hypothetical protein
MPELALRELAAKQDFEIVNIWACDIARSSRSWF